MKLPHVNLSKLWGALGVVAGILASPAVTDLVNAKVAAIAVAVIYLVKTVTGNPPPAGK